MCVTQGLVLQVKVEVTFSWNNLREYIGKKDDLQLSWFNEEVKIPRIDTTSKGDASLFPLSIHPQGSCLIHGG